MSAVELSRQLLLLLDKHCGIDAAPGRAPGWMTSRLERAAKSLMSNPGAEPGNVIEFFEQNPAELERLAELVRVGETRFFRDPEQWRAVASALALLPPRGGKWRALSAGCSTGEEAWTLAMLFGQRRAPFRILGVDRSAWALEQARGGRYAAEALDHVPPEYRRFVAAEGDTLCVSDALVPHVSFSVRDLLAGPPKGEYDLIVCKNVVIYLNSEAQAQLLLGLFASLAPGGFFLVARSELARAKAVGLPVFELAHGVSVVRRCE